MKNLFSCFAFLMILVASSFTLPEPVTTQNTATVAAFDAFLKIEGIDGESRAEGHKGWIELESVAFNTAANTANIVRPKTPVSSPKLAAAAAQGTHFRKAVLHIRKAGGDGSYMKYELKDVLVSSYTVSGATGGSLPMESLSLNYTKIVFQ